MKKIYVAIPYTRMEESSYKQATIATAVIMAQGGHNPFSPITHSHPLTKVEGVEIPGTWEFWSQVDYQYIDWSDEVWVCIPEEGLDRIPASTGVMAEIAYAEKTNKPVRFFRIIDNTVVFENYEIPLQ